MLNVIIRKHRKRKSAPIRYVNRKSVPRNDAVIKTDIFTVKKVANNCLASRWSRKHRFYARLIAFVTKYVITYHI